MYCHLRMQLSCSLSKIKMQLIFTPIREARHAIRNIYMCVYFKVKMEFRNIDF